MEAGQDMTYWSENHRILFAADYPLFSYERLVRDWRAEGYAEEVLEQVFHRNAEAFLASLAT